MGSICECKLIPELISRELIRQKLNLRSFRYLSCNTSPSLRIHKSGSAQHSSLWKAESSAQNVLEEFESEGLQFCCATSMDLDLAWDGGLQRGIGVLVSHK